MNSHHLLLSMDSTIKGKRSTFLIMKHEKNLKDLISLRFSFWKEEEGFEPPRALPPLSVFKTDPFNQTWVFLQKINNFIVNRLFCCSSEQHKLLYSIYLIVSTKILIFLYHCLKVLKSSIWIALI